MIASVGASIPALISTSRSPNVSRMNGSVNSRMSVPTNVFTIPKRSATQSAPKKPPESSIPSSSQAVTMNANAVIARRMRSATSTVG